MTDISQPETLRSHIMHLLEEQKYDEALRILNDLSDRNPSDREFRMYRLLVLRILALRWNLSRTAAGVGIDSGTLAKRIIKSLISAVRVTETAKFIRSLNQVYQTAEAALSKRRMKLIISTGAGTALLALYMVEGSNIVMLSPSDLLSSTYASHATVSGLGAKAFNPNASTLADEDHRPISLLAEAEERNFFPVTSETRQLSPNEYLPDSTPKKLTLSGTDVAKATPQVNASRFFANRQEPTTTLNVGSSRDFAANESDGAKKAREILGYYQSRRPIPIRKSMSFAAAIVQEIDSGIPLNVLEFVGSWAKVEFGPAGKTGFVRREFLTSVKKNESNVADDSPSRDEISDASSRLDQLYGETAS